MRHSRLRKTIAGPQGTGVGSLTRGYTRSRRFGPHLPHDALDLPIMDSTMATQNNRVVTRDQQVESESGKRHLSSDSEEENHKQRKTNDVEEEETGHVPLYLTVKHEKEGQTLAKISPFVINKAIVGAGGQPASIRKLRDGTLLVEAVNEVQASKILKMKSFFDQVSVTVEPHATLNSSKGIMYCRELLDCTLEEVKAELKSQLVSDVVRIMRKDNGNLVPTAGLILTFSSPNPPTKLFVGYMSISVRPYFRNPQRCFKCQKYGHSSKVCKNTETCFRCGQPDHKGEDCSNEEHCANCKGKHPSSSRNCKVFLEEREVLKLSTLEKLSFADARREYKRRQGVSPKSNVSYSQAVSKTPQPAQCSSCTVLEGMVRTLTEQVSLLVQQIGSLVQQPVTIHQTSTALPDQQAAKPVQVEPQPPSKTPLVKENLQNSKVSEPKKPYTKTNTVAAGRNFPATKTKQPTTTREPFPKSAKTLGQTKKTGSPPSTCHSSRSSAMDEDPNDGDCLSTEGFQTVQQKVKKKWEPINFRK